MALPKTFREVEAGWGKDNSSLECELLLHDFFRREEGYSMEHPLILCRDGGLMALYSMDGLDPETMDEDGLEGSSTAIRRSIDVLNPMNQEGEWRHGVWEVQNIWTRSLGAAPTLAQPTRDSAALRYLVDASNNYWQERVVFEDSILWVFRYLPRFREKNPLTWRVWRLRDSTDEAVVKLKVLQEQARMFRRTMRVVEENLMAFSVRRPKMGFGFRALSELEAYKAIWRVVNRRWGEPMAYRPELPLVTQVALSTRDNSGEHYTINGRSTKVLTWKIPPATSIACVLARLQNQVRFPVTVTQTFRCLDFAVLSGRVARLGNFAAALAKRHRESVAYSAEARDFLGSVRTEGACPCNWYFSVLAQGETAAEAEDRATKVATQLKMLDGGHFVIKHEDALFLGPPGTGKSHLAQAIGRAAIQQGHKVLYREAHVLLEELADATIAGKRKERMLALSAAPLLIIDDLGMRKLPTSAGEDLLELVMRRHERVSTLFTSNRPVEDWGKLLGDAAAVSAMLDRLLHHGHVLKCGPRSWRTKNPENLQPEQPLS
jgi:hypothetical protein